MIAKVPGESFGLVYPGGVRSVVVLHVHQAHINNARVEILDGKISDIGCNR